LTSRGLQVTVVEQLDQAMSTIDADLAEVLTDHRSAHGVAVHLGAKVREVCTDGQRLRVDTAARSHDADIFLVVVGVRPNASLAAAAGAQLGIRDAIAVDRGMRTNLPDVYAAGDCVHTYHRLLDDHIYCRWAAPFTSRAGSPAPNAVGDDAVFAGSLGTQAVKSFDLVSAGTGLRDHTARQAGFEPVTVVVTVDDHKSYYPGATPIHIRVTGDRRSGRLLGARLVGHRTAEIAKRVDIFSTAISYGVAVSDGADLDLLYTPPLGSPWDAVQLAAMAWHRQVVASAPLR
jgi:NADPH-dependent 2,4-dienoyl-CoA reductase/sulfur reductase-like enzyme